MDTEQHCNVIVFRSPERVTVETVTPPRCRPSVFTREASAEKGNRPGEPWVDGLMTGEKCDGGNEGSSDHCWWTIRVLAVARVESWVCFEVVVNEVNVAQRE